MPPIVEVNSYTFYAQGPADGREHVPMWIGSEMEWWGENNEKENPQFIIQSQPLPERDLWVIGAALTIRHTSMPPEAIATSWAMAGIAGSGGDYLIPIFTGTNTKIIMFPPGHAMRLRFATTGHNHVDFHVYCPNSRHGVWFGHLTIWTVPA